MKKINALVWIRTVIIVVIGIYIVASLITTLAPTNALFSTIIFGGGVLAVIIYSAKKIIRV